VGDVTLTALDHMDDSGRAVKLKDEFMSFYDTALNYIDKWFNMSTFPKKVGWLMLSNPDILVYEDIKDAAACVCPHLVNNDELFDEVRSLEKW
jgi:hypothetical protein